MQISRLVEKLDKKEAKPIEKFFISSSLCTHTTLADIYYILKDLITVETFYNENLKEVAGLAIGSVVHTALVKEKNYKITDDYYSLVQREYLKCKEDGCKTFYLNSLANALLPQSIEEIFEPEIDKCKTKPSDLCNLSLKTLRKFSSNINLSRKLSDNLLQITQSESINKIEALNLLLHNDETRNNKQVILNILLSMYNTTNFEFTLYAHKMISNLLRSSEDFKYKS